MIRSMWWAESDRDYREELDRYNEPRQRTEPVLVCRCGARMEHGSAIGHLSRQTVCLECAKAEGAEYLRRRATAIEARRAS